MLPRGGIRIAVAGGQTFSKESKIFGRWRLENEYALDQRAAGVMGPVCGFWAIANLAGWTTFWQDMRQPRDWGVGANE